MEERGGISVQTEHIFPIIKRWLYSDKDIFLREAISNASDAMYKLTYANIVRPDMTYGRKNTVQNMIHAIILMAALD